MPSRPGESPVVPSSHEVPVDETNILIKLTRVMVGGAAITVLLAAADMGADIPQVSADNSEAIAGSSLQSPSLVQAQARAAETRFAKFDEKTRMFYSTVLSVKAGRKFNRIGGKSKDVYWADLKGHFNPQDLTPDGKMFKSDNGLLVFVVVQLNPETSWDKSGNQVTAPGEKVAIIGQMKGSGGNAEMTNAFYAGESAEEAIRNFKESGTEQPATVQTGGFGASIAHAEESGR